jgi:hypothetical protein
MEIKRKSDFNFSKRSTSYFYRGGIGIFFGILALATSNDMQLISIPLFLYGLIYIILGFTYLD